MSDDLVKRLRAEPNWMREDYPQSEAADALEAQAAEIARLRAELATARRDALAEIKQDTDELIEQGRQDGMEQAAQRLEELHKNHGYNSRTGKVHHGGKLVECPLTIEHSVGYYRAIAEGVAHIRTAAGEVK